MSVRFDSRRLLAFALVLLVLLGSWLRFDHISRNSLWSDELFIVALALYHPMTPDAAQPWYRPVRPTQVADGDTFLTVKASEQNPPLQDLLAKASVRVLGPTEFAARLPSALAACCLLIGCGWLAWRERDSWVRSVLCWTLLLLAFFPVLVIYAKVGRAYSLGASMIGLGALQWAMRWRNGPREWRPPGWAEVVPFALACLSHYNAAAMVAILVLPDLAMAFKMRSRVAWLRLIGMAALVVPWMAVSAGTILFTARGGAGWGPRTHRQYAIDTVEGALAILHPPWLALVGVLLAGLAAFALRRPADVTTATTRPWSPKVLGCIALAALIVLYVAAAGMMAASAGMSNPRYYIFMIPLAAVMLAIVLAEARQRWLRAACATAVVALAIPWLHSTWWTPSEDYRGMSRYAVQGAADDTVFLFPWRPNRDTYRIYLERMLGTDVKSRMIAVSSSREAPRVCQRLRGMRHVTVLGHASGRPSTDAVYKACGALWPRRYVESYESTFAEHWYAEAPARPPSR